MAQNGVISFKIVFRVNRGYPRVILSKVDFLTFGVKFEILVTFRICTVLRYKWPYMPFSDPRKKM